MPVFQPQIQTLQSWLASIGAGTAFVASGVVMFVILIGATTFDSWPGPGALADGGGVKLNSSPAPARQAAPSVPNLVSLLGPGAGPVARIAGTRQGARGGGPGPRDVGGGQVVPPSGTQSQPPAQTVQPPSAPPSSQPQPQASPRNVVQQAASAVGNSVEGTTTIVGDNLGGSDQPGVGGVVGGLGKTVNGTVQGLVGND